MAVEAMRVWVIIAVPSNPDRHWHVRGAHTWSKSSDPLWSRATSADKALARYLGRAL